MKKKRIIFRGLGPTGNVVYKDEDGKTKIIEDGAIVEMEEEKANAYINLNLAYEVLDEDEARKVQQQVLKNKTRREEVVKVAEEAAQKKEGGKK
ncbi:hypothetical protein [Tepidimicrobium xylanilyticum]|uniref:Uncharacterized protein n=1 Tax=Tepidimicrobium xylanilyticum TaxID=1123352 RepID=A0A1H3ELN7_9FIRM|nr:hypothetical protein [Tepidimicrobium xylanilyticum]GMG96255.1 hypothetical protein EN5CB1_10810 [Tepidimicrobium xylanilyticum]SDX78874.1 hypothetical protein SAMN05660923_02936 [Tepidimicrobium xylanilyticum]